MSSPTAPYAHCHYQESQGSRSAVDTGDVDDVFCQVGIRELWEIGRRVWAVASMCKAFPSILRRLVVILGVTTRQGRAETCSITYIGLRGSSDFVSDGRAGIKSLLGDRILLQGFSQCLARAHTDLTQALEF